MLPLGTYFPTALTNDIKANRMPIHVNALTEYSLEIQLDNPGRHNALTLQDCKDAHRAIKQAERDPSVRTIVVTGANQSFCAGADIDFLHDLQCLDTDDRRRALDVGSQLIKAHIRFHGPTIAGVDGPAIGIGASLALACDRVLATERSRFGLTFTSLGLPGGDMAASWLVARRAGSRAANTLFADAATIDAAAAAQLGLVDRIVESVVSADIARDADTRSEQVAPNAAAITKQQILELEGAFADLDWHMASQLDALVSAVGGHDFDEALRARSAKVAPVFERRQVGLKAHDTDDCP